MVAALLEPGHILSIAMARGLHKGVRDLHLPLGKVRHNRQELRNIDGRPLLLVHVGIVSREVGGGWTECPPTFVTSPCNFARQGVTTGRDRVDKRIDDPGLSTILPLLSRETE